MRLSLAATACVLLALATIPAGCGDEDRTATLGEGETARSASVAGHLPPPRLCRRQVNGFLASMGVLRERLAVGLSYDDYLRAVREARSAYEEVPARRMEIECLLASGTPGERALNSYLDAANVWGECLASVRCETEAVEPELQRHWELASNFLTSAQRGLRSLHSPPSS